MPKKILKKQSKPLALKKNEYLSQINWGESYTSLFLGAVVVVVALILLFSFLKAKSIQNQETQSTSTNSNEEMVNGRPTSYVVKSGEGLWQISEIIYKSGYNWVDIARANHLQNPNVIYPGTKLIIPNIEPKIVTVSPSTTNLNSIKGNMYTIVKGDFLWNIAIRAYGDGYKWTLIAKANNLLNPNLIHSGNVLKLPR